MITDALMTQKAFTRFKYAEAKKQIGWDACQTQNRAAIGNHLPEFIGLFLGSSVVEQLTVNQLVGGSNPSRGAIFR
jgi:hypothetical protein